MKVAVVAKERKNAVAYRSITARQRPSLTFEFNLWYCQQNLSAVCINHSKRLEAVLQMVMHVCSRS